MFKKIGLILGLGMFLSFGVWGFVGQPIQANEKYQSQEFMPTPTPKKSPTVSPTVSPSPTESPSPSPSPTVMPPDMPMPSPSPTVTPKP